ncbi:hypothetical protein [Kitasatospora cathayae]|uniref:Uncharacterized protein n=1 Tax=Kitasatospora cathayae TaxID=3004092 RepID=A0ABY7QB68_9ACTN|nr:hypothetical protein [Kitasatospora sp. HUAS 3-15]WBP89469.1 hypothetical protein O1G21_28960 [Kitasatospora sp. HUAS 3-15]
MHVCTTADLGPSFIAWAGVVNGSTTALITERANDDDETAEQAVELLRRLGIDCSTCTACPLGLNRRVN